MVNHEEKYEVRSLWNGVEILRCQHVPTSPHDTQLGHTAQGPARSPQCCCWLPAHGDLSQEACKGPTFLTITLTAVFFCKTANAYCTCLVIIQNIHQTIHQSNCARIQPLSFWKPSHLWSLCTTWPRSKAPASPFVSHERNMSRHNSSKKSDSDSSWTCFNAVAGLV